MTKKPNGKVNEIFCSMARKVTECDVFRDVNFSRHNKEQSATTQ